MFEIAIGREADMRGYIALGIFCLTALLAFLFWGCAPSLPAQSTTLLEQAASLNAQAYCAIDAGGNGSVPRALERGAYVATAAVLAQTGTPLPDGGPQCSP
jgi:hypothetical protein